MQRASAGRRCSRHTTGRVSGQHAAAATEVRTAVTQEQVQHSGKRKQATSTVLQRRQWQQQQLLQQWHSSGSPAEVVRVK
jgi:hypothetical protein